jgi:hypothetical protein
MDIHKPKPVYRVLVNDRFWPKAEIELNENE